MKLVAVAGTLRNRALIVTLAGTGAEVGEVVSLKVRDVSSEGGAYKFHFANPRPRGRERTSPLVDGTYAKIIEEWLEAIPSPTPESWLFPSTKSPKVHITKGTVRTMLQGRQGHTGGLRAMAGLAKPCNPHSFRHARAVLGIIRCEDRRTLCLGLWGVPQSRMVDKYAHFEAVDPETVKVFGNGPAQPPSLPPPLVDTFRLRLDALEYRMEEYRQRVALARVSARLTAQDDEIAQLREAVKAFLAESREA